jgi:putative copper export protein
LKILVVLVLIVIVGSLGQALFYLLKDRERSPRTVRALTLRIGLSIGLFVLLLISFSAGLIKPHGLRPGIAPKPGTTSEPSNPSQPQ